MSIGKIINGIPWGAKRSRQLALDFDVDFVSLFERQGHGSWTCIGSAALSAPDFIKQIDGLRIEALVRDKHRSPVTIWLPDDQILFRQYDLMDRYGTAAKAEALRHIAEDSPYQTHELIVAVADPGHGKPVNVLAALRQTVSEAIEYTEKWGFVPGIVSTRAHAEDMGPVEPSFLLQETISARAGRVAKGTAVATGALLAVSIGGLGAYHVAAPALVQPKTVNSSVALSVPLVFDQASLALSDTRLGPTWVGNAQQLGFQTVLGADARDVAARQHDVMADLPADAYPGSMEPAEIPTEMVVGAVSGETYRTRPGKLAPPAQVLRGRSLQRMAAGLRVQEGEPTATELARAKTLKVPSAPESAPERVIGSTSLALLSPVSLRAPFEDQIAEQDDAEADGDNLLTRAIDATLIENGIAAEPADTTTNETDDAGSEDATEFAPEDMAATPKSRPADLAAAAAVELAKGTPATEPTSENEDAASTPPAKTEEPAEVAEAPVAQPQPRAAREDSTELASIDPSSVASVIAPKPLIRPRNLITIKPRVDSALPKRATKILPRTVRAAARESGLELGQTSLIGVIEANSGRQALVRMPTGDYRKVTRGDVLDGWRVGSVGRETLRLSKRGQNRTLLLVTR